MTEKLPERALLDKALEIWRRRKWLLLACFASVFSVVAGLVTALPPLYRSSTTILFGQDDITESLVKPGLPNELELRLGIIRQAVLSRSQLQEVIDAFDLYAPLRAQAPPESVIDRLRADIDVEQRAYAQPEWGKESTFAITISYQGWDPELVARVANDLAARFKAENEKIRSGRAARTTEFIDQQLDVARQAFTTQQSRINAFRNEHMGELPEQQDVNLATLERLNSELLLNGEKQVQLSIRRDAALLGNGAGGPGSSMAGLTGALRLERLERDLSELRTLYTESYPGIIRLRREIDTVKRDLAGDANGSGDDAGGRSTRPDPDAMDRELAELKASERQLNASIAALMRRIEGTPRIDQELKRFTYDYEMAKEEYMSLQKLSQEAQLAQSLEVQQNQQVKVIEPAIPPNFPFAPDRNRLLFVGFVLAAGFAAAVVLLMEALKRNFADVAAVRRFTRVPVLASIANIRTSRERWLGKVRFGVIAALFLVGVILMTSTSYQAGEGGEQLVWRIAG